jgi:hypothetical protein
LRAKSINEGLLDDVNIDKDKFIKSANPSSQKLEKIKDFCEKSIQATNEYFSEVEEEGMDVEDMDPEEMDNYSSNSAINNMANQILEIINAS